MFGLCLVHVWFMSILVHALSNAVRLIKKTAYDTAWNDIANKGIIKET